MYYPHNKVKMSKIVLKIVWCIGNANRIIRQTNHVCIPIRYVLKISQGYFEIVTYT